jgi:hypothetical protein
MNNDTMDGRCRRRLSAALTAGVAGFALLAAACGGGGSAGGSGTSQTPYQQALAYARCMRSHGEPGFPDPTSQGAFSRIPPPSPQYQSANKACQHLLPSQPLTAAQKQEHVSQALRFAGCMRSHGVPSFPDPTIAQGGTAVGFRMSGIDRSSPHFQAAAQTCRKFEPGMAGLMAGGGAP